MAFQVAKPENYWISPKALNIQLNAMGDADYIQASVAAGATILCYVNGVEGLEFDVGHNYNHWPLTISPTYFPTTTRKYVYVAIPRTERAGTDAMVVFPSEKLDIYGKNEAGDQVGDADKYYIWLQGIISGYMGEAGNIYREWEAPLHTGLLNSDESYKAGGEDTWWIWDPVSDMVTFLKKIAYAVFEYLKADQAEVGALTVTGRSDLNEVHISGPAYGDHFQSSHYTGDGMFDSGFLLRYADGHAKLVIDDLVCRGKFTVNEIEDRIWTYSGGNLVFSSAGSTIHYVEYLDANDEPLGYTYINSRWLLAGIRLLARRYPWARKKFIQRSLTPDERSRVVKFRCYETSDNGTMQTRNWWHIDDIAFCQTLNRVKNKTIRSGEYSGSLSNTVYARRVINIGSKKIEYAEDNLIYDYVDLSLTDHEAGYDDWPMAGDVIVQRGNFTDSSRQGLTTIEVTGDQRGLKVYDGFNSYSKDGKQKAFLGYDATLKRGLLEVFGDAYIGAMGDTAEDIHNGSTFIRYNSETKLLEIKARISILSTIGNQSIPDYIHDNTWSEEQIEQMIGDDISVVQKQLDGNFTIYYGTDYPSPSNYPANEWTTTELKEQHLYDLFYDKVHDAGWRWTKTIDGRGHVTYGWMRIGDSSILASLKAAADAQDTADGKRRVFVTAANVLPTPPYDAGDLWTNATYGIYTNEILRCTTSRASGATASISDWTKASKYTDDAVFNDFFANTYSPFATDIQSQVDGKAETWYQNTNPATAWTTVADKKKHVGDLWYCTADISGTNYKKGTTWFYKMGGTASNPTFSWEQQDVPEAVFDKIDGKAAIYVSWQTEWDTSTASLNVGDMLVPSADVTKGGKTYKAQKVYKWNGSEWKEIDYTDDTAFNNFFTNTYTPFAADIKSQVDQKAETWYQATDPSVNWNTTEKKNAHKGDIWHNTSSSTIAGVGPDLDAIWSGTAWVVSDVPQGVYDKIDGKADIFVSKPTTYNANDLWIIESGLSASDMPSGCQAGDIVISSAKRTNSYNKADWKKKDRYTDDSGLSNWITNTYAQDKTNILGQLDKKAETWYQATDPSTSWTTTELKNTHKGDIWHNTSSSTIAGVGPDLDAIWSGTAWVVSDVPQGVYDKIDGKADIFVSKPTTYNANDLWIIESGLSASDMPSGCQAGDIVISSAKRTNSYNKADWKKKDRYTDDSGLTNWIRDTYVPAITGLENADAETKVEVHSAAWQAQWAYSYAEFIGNADASFVKGPLDAIAADGVVKSDEKWKITNATTDASKDYNTAKTKAEEVNIDTTAFTAAYNAMVTAVAKYTAASPADITVQSDYQNIYAFYQKMAALYNQIGDKWHTIASSAKNTADDADAKADAMEYLTVALNQKTEGEGGLILTSLIALRDGSNKVWSGINGVFNSSLRGNGIAAWFGGGMIDHEAHPSTANYAKTLFRMDGTGYMASGAITWNADGSGSVAGGKITWDANGVLNAANFSSITPTMTNISVDGVTITAAQLKNLAALFQMFTLEGAGTSGSPYVIKANYSLYTVGALAAKGNASGGGGGGQIMLSTLADVQISNIQNNQVPMWNSSLGKWVNGTVSGGGGGADMATVWAALAQATNEPINISHLTAIPAWARATNKPSYAWSEITGKPDSFTPASHSHPWSEVTGKPFNYTGQSGQPSWVWGSNDGTNYYVWDPSNFSVYSAGRLTNARSLWGQSFNGTGDVSGDMSSVGHLTFSHSETRFTPSGGYTDPAPGYDMAFKFGGSLAATSIYSRGSMSAVSDIRFKNVEVHFSLDAKTIANASIIRFTWKDNHDGYKHVGGIAQEWQKILPETVAGGGEKPLAMDYGTISYVSVVSLARTVVLQDEQIRQQAGQIKQQNELIRQQNEQIKKLEERLARIESMLGLN